ncbi:unnamed protein product [Prorocentrum cordatum]|uniref:Uncharacterized protein n=1 Tax=Prorocentrum cordatum TaxID=2364126 RepID=A0ABN9XXP6_9DINO|nr:unnamed protein product [Polarella glacialis]
MGRPSEDGWDVLKIGYWGSEWPCDEVAKGVYLARLAGGKSKVMGCSHNYAGTQAYVVTARSAGRVLSVLDEEEIRDIDQLLCTGLQCAWRMPGRKTPMVYALSDLKPYFKDLFSESSDLAARADAADTRGGAVSGCEVSVGVLLRVVPAP